MFLFKLSFFVFFFLFYLFLWTTKEKSKIYKIFSSTYPVVTQHARDVILVLRCPYHWQWWKPFPPIRLGIGWWRSLPRRLVWTGYSNLHEHPEGIPIILVSIGVLQSPRRQTTIMNLDLLLLLNTGRCWKVLSRGTPICSRFATGVVGRTVGIVIIPVKREMLLDEKRWLVLL